MAFFPVFPIAIRWLSSRHTLSPLVVGLVISGVTGLTAVVAIGLLVRRFAGKRGGHPRDAALRPVPRHLRLQPGLQRGHRADLHRSGADGAARATVVAGGLARAAWRRRPRPSPWRSSSAAPGPPVGPPGADVAFVPWWPPSWRRSASSPTWLGSGVTPVSLNAWRLTEQGGWKGSVSLAYPFRVLGTFVRNPLSPTLTGQILVVGTLVAIIGAVLAIRQRQPAPVLIYGLAAAFLAAIAAPVGLRPRFIMLAFPLVVAYGTRLRGRAYAGVAAGLGIPAGGHERARVRVVGRVPLTDPATDSLLVGTSEPNGPDRPALRRALVHWSNEAAGRMAWFVVLTAGLGFWSGWTSWPGAAGWPRSWSWSASSAWQRRGSWPTPASACCRGPASRVATLTVGVPQAVSIHVRRYYTTDSAAFNQLATRALLHGKDPYETSDGVRRQPAQPPVALLDLFGQRRPRHAGVLPGRLLPAGGAGDGAGLPSRAGRLDRPRRLGGRRRPPLPPLAGSVCGGWRPSSSWPRPSSVRSRRAAPTRSSSPS